MMYDDDLPPVQRTGRSYYATLVPFSAACFILALLTDLAYVASLSVLWETASVWLLAVGLVVAGIAVVAGIVDLVRSRTDRLPRRAPLRVFGELVAFALAFVNVLIHSRDGYTAVVPEGLILSILTVALLALTLFAGHRRARTPSRGYA